jgi:hypothetical protein
MDTYGNILVAANVVDAATAGTPYPEIFIIFRKFNNEKKILKNSKKE